MTKTLRKKTARAGRRFDKLVTFYTAQLDGSDEAARREAAATLTKILIHVEEMAEKRYTRLARAKEAKPEPPLPTDPAALEATIAKLKAQARGGAQ